MKRRTVLVAVLTLALCLSAAGGALAQVYGGTVKIAVETEPANLDIQMTPSDQVSYIAQHIFEQLFAFDEAFNVVPMLADSYESNDEGTEFTIYLRKGVLFHNGKEMTAEDVIASLYRWSQVSARGATAAEYITEVEQVDDYSIVLRLKEPFAPLLSFLAFQNTAASIYPKEICEKYPTTPIEEYIGTGPYKFAHWMPDYRIRLERFDDYVARDDEPSGWGGKKVAYLDAVEYYTVLEPYTRQAGVQAGDYHVGMFINREAYPELVNDPNVNTHMLSPGGFGWIIFNKAQGIMTNQKLRQAALAAMDMEPILAASYGLADFYLADPSYYPKGTVWYTDAGGELYDQNNIERAKQLVKEAGYNGEPIRLISTAERPEFLNIALVAASQWQEAGLNVDVQLYDWATVLERRANPEANDAFVTAHGFVPDPSLITILSSSYPGWWDSPAKNELLAKFQSEPDQEKRMELWAELQALIYEEVPAIRIGDYYSLTISRKELKNFQGTTWPVLWNVWLEE
jgi:peptide/nickel transport system substrate-binding protein